MTATECPACGTSWSAEGRLDWLEQRHEDMVVLVQQMQERAQRAEADLRRLRKVEKGYRTVADMAWRLRAENNELRALLDAAR